MLKYDVFILINLIVRVVDYRWICYNDFFWVGCVLCFVFYVYFDGNIFDIVNEKFFLIFEM